MEVSSTGDVKWYANLVSTDVLNSGATFVTTLLSNDTLFYVAAVYGSCSQAYAIPVSVQLKPAPQPPAVSSCN